MRIASGVVLLAALLSACASFDPPRRADSGPDAWRRQILVTVRQEDAAAVRLLGAPNARYTNRRGYGPSPDVERTLNRLAKEHGMKRVDGWPIASLDVHCEVFAVADGTSIDALIGELSADPSVDLVQRMNTFETLASGYDDPYADLQDAIRQLDIERAHGIATGKGVTIAVIDSKIDDAHPDLRGRIGMNRDFTDRRSNDRNGEIHGTAIAGVIASRANNRVGIVGIAPDATIAGLRACWAAADDVVQAQCSSFSLAQALEAAISLSPAIVNLSLVGPFDPLLSRLIDVALARGIVVVAAAPESPRSAERFPASHDRVFAAESGEPALESASRFAVSAPGSEILTTTPDGQYAFLSGNSFAAANVTGVIALMKETSPTLDIEALAGALSASTTRGPNTASVNACRALALLVGRDGDCAAPVDSSSSSWSARR